LTKNTNEVLKEGLTIFGNILHPWMSQYLID